MARGQADSHGFAPQGEGFAIGEPALVERRTEAQWRIYRLNPEALREADRWMAKYRTFWAARMHDLKRFVEETP